MVSFDGSSLQSLKLAGATSLRNFLTHPSMTKKALPHQPPTRYEELFDPTTKKMVISWGHMIAVMATARGTPELIQEAANRGVVFNLHAGGGQTVSEFVLAFMKHIARPEGKGEVGSYPEWCGFTNDSFKPRVNFAAFNRVKSNMRLVARVH